MSCPHAKPQWPGHAKPYQVCLNPEVKLCKCFSEDKCPLRNGGGRLRAEEPQTSDGGSVTPDLFLFGEDELKAMP